MTLRHIISTNTHVVTTPHRYDKLSTTILRGMGLWPEGVSVTNSPDISRLPSNEKNAAITAQHRALWEKCITENKPMCIIEDDAWCLRTAHPVLEDTEALAPGNVIYFLGATYPHIALEGEGIARLCSGMGTHAYVITPDSARVLCEVEGILVVDHITDAAMKRSLTIGLLLLPEIFCQLDAPGDIAVRSSFGRRHQGRFENSVISADLMLGNAPGDASIIQAQMQRSLWTPRPTAQDVNRTPEDCSISQDDISVLSQIVEFLKSHRQAHPLTVLEFGSGRSTDLFLSHNCLVRSFENHPERTANLSFPAEKMNQLQVLAIPLHPEEISVEELSEVTGFGYDLAFVDSPSCSGQTGRQDRRVTLECALRNAEVVVLHDAHQAHEQNLLYEAAQCRGRCIRRIDTQFGMAVLFKRGSFTL